MAEAAEAPEKTQESAPSAELPYLYQRLLAALTSPLINLFPPEKTRKDLTLGNFFTYGWKQGWAEPEEGPQDAPRFRLMRIRRAFWERELRATYNFTFRANKYLGAEFPLAGYGSGAPDAIFQYAIAPVITVTLKATPYFGNLTFFLELNGDTNLGGDRHTTITLLPGTRWLVVKDVWVAAGYEIPITHTDEFAGRIWASLSLISKDAL